MTTHTKTVTNGVNMEALGKAVEAIQEDPQLAQSTFRVHNKWASGGVNQTRVQNFQSLGQENAHLQDFELHSDEPLAFGGTDSAANPVEHLLNALAGCVTTSIVAHAAVRGIPIEEIESQLEGDIDIRGFLGLDPSVPKGYQDIRITFKIKAAPEDIGKLMELVEFSPVYKTLTQGTNVDVQIQPK
ncbi:MAG: OsmC family protein [Planctomycetota bacterium]